MKRRLISFVLVAVSLFSLVGNCFAADVIDSGTTTSGSSEIVPFGNRHHNVTVTDPNWTSKGSFTVTYAQAENRQTLEVAIMAGLGALGLNAALAPITTIATMGVVVGMVADPYRSWGTYTVEMKNKVVYDEDRLTGERHVLERYEIHRISLNQNGQISTREYTLHLK